jgi:hypothetical protein
MLLACPSVLQGDKGWIDRHTGLRVCAPPLCLSILLHYTYTSRLTGNTYTLKSTSLYGLI